MYTSIRSIFTIASNNARVALLSTVAVCSTYYYYYLYKCLTIKFVITLAGIKKTISDQQDYHYKISAQLTIIIHYGHSSIVRTTTTNTSR